MSDVAAEAFAKYNGNGDDMLSLDELQVMLTDVWFEVDDSYVDGLAGMFGTWDADGSGGIELPEFRVLWEQLGLGELLGAAAGSSGHRGAVPPPPPEEDSAAALAFRRYNSNGDDMLSLDELTQMLADAQFEVDDAYVDGLAGMFGSYDGDGSGGIELREFERMWEALSLGKTLPPPPPEDASGGSPLPPPPPEDDSDPPAEAVGAPPPRASLRAPGAGMRVFVRRGADGYGLDIDLDGVVLEVLGPAEEAGIKAGWTITAVDGDPVNGQDAIFAILGQVQGAELTLEKREQLPP